MTFLARGILPVLVTLLTWVVPVASAAGTAADAPSAPAERPAAAAETAGVYLDGELLFTVHREHGMQTVEARARAAEETVLRIAQDPFYSNDVFDLVEDEDGVRIYYRNGLVGFVGNKDAARLGLSARERAGDLVDIVRDAVTRYRDRREPEEWARATLWVLVCTVVLVALVFGVQRAHRKLVDLLEARARAGVVVAGQRLPFFESRRLEEYQRRAVGALRALVLLVVALVYLQAVFTIIPITRGYAYGVIAYLLDPLRTLWTGFLENVGGIFFVLVMILLARFVLRMMRLLLYSAARGSVRVPGVPPDRAKPLYKILRLVVIAFTVVVVYPYIPGSRSAAFQGISIFAGALFTLGASGAAANFVGGVVLVFTSAFQVGDRVKIGDVTGDVEETTLALTRLRTPKNELVTLSNATVLSNSFVNYSALARHDGLILHTTITLGYDVPWRRVHELMLEAARRTRDVLESPAAYVLQTSLNDFHVSYELNAYTREANAMSRLYGELHQNLQDVFSEAGVEILSPGYAALRDGRASTVVAQEGRAAPGDAETPAA